MKNFQFFQVFRFCFEKFYRLFKSFEAFCTKENFLHQHSNTKENFFHFSNEILDPKSKCSEIPIREKNVEFTFNCHNAFEFFRAIVFKCSEFTDTVQYIQNISQYAGFTVSTCLKYFLNLFSILLNKFQLLKNYSTNFKKNEGLHSIEKLSCLSFRLKLNI